MFDTIFKMSEIIANMGEIIGHMGEIGADRNEINSLDEWQISIILHRANLLNQMLLKKSAKLHL